MRLFLKQDLHLSIQSNDMVRIIKSREYKKKPVSWDIQNFHFRQRVCIYVVSDNTLEITMGITPFHM